MTGAPVMPCDQPTPSNLSPPEMAKERQSASWCSPRMFTQNAPALAMRGQLVELRAGARMTIGGSSESAAKDWQREADGDAVLQRGDDGDPGGEVAEHLAEPGLVEARHAAALAALRLAEVDRLGLVRRRDVLDGLGLGEPAGLVEDAVELAVGVRRVVVREQQPLRPPPRRPRARRRRRSSGPSRPWPRTRRRCTGRRGSAGPRPGRARARSRGWPGGRAGPGGPTCRRWSVPRPRSGSRASRPACGMGRAITLAEPMEKSSEPTSMVMSSPRNCSMWMGKTGGCTAACSASFRVPLGCAGP